MKLFNKCMHEWKLDYEHLKKPAWGTDYVVRVYICEKCGKIKKVEI